MMRALFSGVTGLRSHQTKMDVIGNNIANVNTVGFKKNTVTFKDLYNETVSAAAAQTGAGNTGTGGVNAKQIGLGSTVDSIQAVHTPGSSQYTGSGMDVAISGDGYFAVMSPTGLQYTRAGNFFTDLSGNLVTSEGYYIMTVAPRVTASQSLTQGTVATNNLINQSAGIRDAAHTGTVTADLTQVNGAEYSLVYQPSADGAWAVQYGSGTTKTYTPLASSGFTGSLDVDAMRNIINNKANDATNHAKAGTNQISFKTVPDTTSASGYTINMMFGDMVVASAPSATIPGADTTNPVRTQAFNFKDANGNSIGTLTFNYQGSQEIQAQNVADSAFNKSLAQLPTLTLKEQGSWYLSRNGSTVEQVTMDYTSSTSGGIAGDVVFNTAEYGKVTLSVEEGKIANQTELNKALTGGTFTIGVNTEYVPQYQAPKSVTAANLNALRINFDNYSSIAIDSSGAVVGQLKNDMQLNIEGRSVNMKAGDKVVLGYIAMASFNNPSGLEKVGDNQFMVSANSGEATYGTPGNGTVGSLSPSNLEMSNVDLSEEMVNMIITQRGFQANSRIITTTDTMLEELVNLKR